MKQISVIVAVYNVQDYIERCIKSIVRQKNIEMELILVDDGSTDSSGTICDEWEKKDKRIIVVHKENGGLSNTRNVGLDVATGEFVTFVDGDDYIPDGILEYQYTLAISNNVDVVCSAYADVMHEYYTDLESTIITGVEAAKRMFIRMGIDSNSPCKLYKKKLFDKICFPEGMLYENVAVTYKVLLKAEHVYVSNVIGYYIETRDNSITRSSFKAKDMDYVHLAQSMFDDIVTTYPELTEYAKSFYLESIIFLMEKLCNKKSDQMSESKLIISKFRCEFFSIIRSRYIGKRKKIISILIMTGLYKIVWRTYFIIRQNKTKAQKEVFK